MNLGCLRLAFILRCIRLQLNSNKSFHLQQTSISRFFIRSLNTRIEFREISLAESEFPVLPKRKLPMVEKKFVEDHKWLWRTTKLLNFLNRLERPSPLSIPRIPSYSIQRAYKQLSFVILFASLLSYSDHPACRKKGWISVFLITFVRRKINFLPQYADATWKDGTKQSPLAKHHSVFCTNTRLCKIM